MGMHPILLIPVACFLFYSARRFCDKENFIIGTRRTYDVYLPEES